MRENIYDAVKMGILDILLEAKKVVGKEFKRTNPFGKVPMTQDEIMKNFNNLPFEEKQRIISQLGGKK